MVDHKKGRPQKEEGARKDHVLSTKVSNAEYRIILKKLERLKIDMSQYVRDAAINLSLSMPREKMIRRKIDKITVSQLLRLAVVHTHVVSRISKDEMDSIKNLAAEIHELNGGCKPLLNNGIGDRRIREFLASLDAIQNKYFNKLL